MMLNRTSALVLGTVALAVANPAIAKTYDCQVGPPQALFHDGTTTTLKTINFPDLKSEDWSFQIEVKKGKNNEPDAAIVKWRNDPIQIAGIFPVMTTADRTIAFTAVAPGPCMFTSYGCLSTVQIAEQKSGQAKISILPTALWKDDATGTSDPFVAVIDGTCTWKES